MGGNAQVNTRTAEITILLNDILKEALQHGITPDVVQLANSRQFHNLGEVTNFPPLDRTIAKSDDMNANLSRIEYYSRVFDQAASMQLDDIKEHRDNFPSRVSRLERWYRELAYKVDSLVFLTRSGTSSLYSITEAFSSLDKLDMGNTTAYIDTDNGVACIGFSTFGFDPDTGAANVLVRNVKIVDGSKIQSIVGSSHISAKYTTASSAGVYLTANILVGANSDIYSGGYLEFDVGFAQTSKVVSVRGTSDNVNFEDLAYLETNGHYAIPISKTYLDKQITIEVLKTNYEGVKIDERGNVIHQYLFDIKNIHIPNRRYKSSATVQSTEHKIPEVLQSRGISHCKLVVDGLTDLGDNSIEAYLGFGNSSWQKVNSGIPIPIGVANTGRSLHPSGVSIRSLPTPIFKLDGSSPDVVIDQSRLLEGFNQVEVESILYNISYANLEQWAKSGGTKAYQDLEDSLYLAAGQSHKVYTQIRSDTARDVILTGVGVKSQEAAGNQATFTTVIFNGQILQGKILPDGRYEYRLAVLQGNNTLNILLGIRGTAGGFLNIGGSLNDPDFTTFVKQRGATTLQALLALNATDKAYAVYNGYVYVNYTPPIGVRFAQEYTLPTAQLPQTVKVRLTLNGDGATSPIVSGYKLEFSPGRI
jgi:hypothetical protein